LYDLLKNWTAKGVASEVNDCTQSGFGAVSGVADSRDLEDLYFSGNENASLAVEMFCYKIAKTMASYFVPLEGMAILVVEFLREGYKIRKVFG
jgi:acetate kinase